MSTGHIVPIRVYLAVFIGLLICTGLTVLAASYDLGHINPYLNTIVALTIAVFKASIVVIFFMGLRFNTPLTKVVAVSGVVWLMILFVLGMGDYLTRPWMHVLGR